MVLKQIYASSAFTYASDALFKFQRSGSDVKVYYPSMYLRAIYSVQVR